MYLNEARSLGRSRGVRQLIACLVISTALCAPRSVVAKPLSQELGDNLLYFRAELLPRDLPPADVKAGPLILDLRFAQAERDAPAAFEAWLKRRATPGTPVFLLINPDTAEELREMLAKSGSRPSVITIARKSEKTKPDIEVDTTSEEERRAYDALEQNKPIESLLVENADKPRVDEASIMRARDEEADDPFDADARDRIDSAGKKSDAKPASPIDRALQRAVHVHRALRALKRL